MWRRYLFFLIVISIFACGPDETVQGNGDGGDGLDPDGGASADGMVDALECTGGTLCGEPVACCPAGNECVDDRCLPVCASGVRCGAELDICCSAGEVCIAGECATPGSACGDSYDCVQPGEFCEPTLSQCLRQPDPVTCEIIPSFTNLSVMVEWSFTSDEIISIPVVGNLDADPNPEVVVNVARQAGGDWPDGNIVVLDGRTGAEALRIPHDPANGRYGSHGRSTIAIGDVSGDLVPDIVYASRALTPPAGLVVAVHADGMPLWTSHFVGGAPHNVRVENGAATLANFDADPQAEVVFGAILIDHDGTVVWDAGGGGGDGGIYGSNANYRGGISVVADLDGDGAPEIVSGKQAWKVNFPSVTPYWTYAGDDGYPGVADLDGDGTPEVVLVANGRVILLDGQTGRLWCAIDPSDVLCTATPALRTQPLAIPGGSMDNRGGPPTIADFDGDGHPEIGVAGGHSYSVYDLESGLFRVKWSHGTRDLSSNCSGSSVFDFQGDGAAEVIYADECYVRVYDGTSGAIELQIPSSSATIHEYPLVVDVDGDGNSEILIVANDSDGFCDDIPGYVTRRGLYVYGDPNDEWVPTRRVWPQHSYHVTNATSDGNVPASEADNWTTAGLNNYRQNVQGEGVFNAPDLTVDLSVSVDPCLSDVLELRARVSNGGALGVPAGVPVRFYQGTDASGTFLGMATTAVPLLPGNATTITLTLPAPGSRKDYFVEVDGGGSTVAECNETNNHDGLVEVGCDLD